MSPRGSLTRGIVAAVLASALACGDAQTGGTAGGALEVRDARVVPPPAGRGPAGGFLTLVNGSDAARVLTGASSPDAGRVELHRSWIEDGIARMERVDALSVGAGETVVLEPGGLHLMVFDAPGLAPGGAVTLRLAFADGEVREVVAAVRGGPGAGDAHDAHAGHEEEAHAGHEGDAHAGHGDEGHADHGHEEHGAP